MPPEDNVVCDAPSQSEKADENCVVLSDRDADRVLEIAQNPPAPNEAARRTVERFKKLHGS